MPVRPTPAAQVTTIGCSQFSIWSSMNVTMRSICSMSGAPKSRTGSYSSSKPQGSVEIVCSSIRITAVISCSFKKVMSRLVVGPAAPASVSSIIQLKFM